MVCTHCPTLPHESAIEYILAIVLGQVPISVSLAANEFISRAQLSEALPPLFIKSW
jgi:hypothetical protein